MASDISEGVRILAGAPVLKIGVAIIPLLHQASGAEAKLAELPGTILAPCQQTAVVKTFVILDPDEEASAQSIALDGFGFLQLHHQGLDNQQVLAGFKC